MNSNAWDRWTEKEPFAMAGLWADMDDYAAGVMLDNAPDDRAPKLTNHSLPQSGIKGWVTMGGGPCEDGEGQHCGGTPVELDGSGKITKGPAGTVGKKPNELKKSSEKPEAPGMPKVTADDEDAAAKEVQPKNRSLGDKLRAKVVDWLKNAPEGERKQVENIAAKVKAGQVMPPVIIKDWGDGDENIVDGWHRAAGHYLAGIDEIPAYTVTAETEKHLPKDAIDRVKNPKRNGEDALPLQNHELPPPKLEKNADKPKHRIITDIDEMINVQAEEFAKQHPWGEDGFTREQFVKNWKKKLKKLAPDPAKAKELTPRIDAAFSTYGLDPVPVFIRKGHPDENESNAHWGNGYMMVMDDVLDDLKYHKTPVPLGTKHTFTIKESYPDPLQGLVVHEMGHKNHKDSPAVEKRAMVLMSDHATIQQVKNLISGYAATNYQELAAEAFTMRKHPDFNKLGADAQQLVKYVLGEVPDPPEPKLTPAPLPPSKLTKSLLETYWEEK